MAKPLGECEEDLRGFMDIYWRAKQETMWKVQGNVASSIIDLWHMGYDCSIKYTCMSSNSFYFCGIYIYIYIYIYREYIIYFPLR